MKKIFVPIVVMVVGMLISGCAAPAGAPAPEEPAGRFAQPNPLWGVGFKPDGTAYKFVHLPPYSGVDWMECFFGVSDSLIHRSGAEVETMHANFSLENQVAAFDDALVVKPDAIFISAIDSSAFDSHIARAVEAGIPVFDYDHVTENPAVISSVTHDQVKCGEVAGQWLVDYAEATGEHLYVYELWGEMSSSGAQYRHRGYHNALDGQDLITVLEGPDTGWMSENAMNAVLDTFPAHPELNAIASPYDMTWGITEALRTLGRLYPAGDPNHVLVVTMDEEPATLDHIREGLIDGTAAHGPWEEADPLVKIMLAYVCLEETVPKDLIISTYMVTSDNIDMPRWGAPMIWGDMMGAEENFDLWPILDTSEIGIETPTIK